MIKITGLDMQTQALKSIISDPDKRYFLQRFQLPTAPSKTLVQQELRVLHV